MTDTPPPTSCPETADLEAFVTDGDVDRRVAEHLRTCASCRALVEEMRDNAALFSRFIEASLAHKVATSKDS